MRMTTVKNNKAITKYFIWGLGHFFLIFTLWFLIKKVYKFPSYKYFVSRRIKLKFFCALSSSLFKNHHIYIENCIKRRTSDSKISSVLNHHSTMSFYILGLVASFALAQVKGIIVSEQKHITFHHFFRPVPETG